MAAFFRPFLFRKPRATKVSKKKDAPRKTTKEHLSDFAGTPGKKIGGRGFLVG